MKDIIKHGCRNSMFGEKFNNTLHLINNKQLTC